jgi:hypothetical protein
VGALVELDVGEAQDPVVIGLVAGAAQDGMDPGDELGQREGLGDVVVAADGQAGQLVLQGVAGGQEEDGDAEPSARSRRVTSRPSRSGSITSRMTRSGGSSWAWASALRPSSPRRP